MVDAIAQLLCVEDLLRHCWSTHTYGAQGHQQRDAQSIRIDIVDGAIADGMLWSYCRMMGAIGEALAELSQWSEGCPCCYR